MTLVLESRVTTEGRVRPDPLTSGVSAGKDGLAGTVSLMVGYIYLITVFIWIII